MSFRNNTEVKDNAANDVKLSQEVRVMNQLGLSIQDSSKDYFLKSIAKSLQIWSGEFKNASEITKEKFVKVAFSKLDAKLNYLRKIDQSHLAKLFDLFSSARTETYKKTRS